jgi:hypothetical protein
VLHNAHEDEKIVAKGKSMHHMMPSLWKPKGLSFNHWNTIDHKQSQQAFVVKKKRQCTCQTPIDLKGVTFLKNLYAPPNNMFIAP